MLIGQIEQEILEGRFWCSWLQIYPDSAAWIDLQTELQTERNSVAESLPSFKSWRSQRRKMQREDWFGVSHPDEGQKPN